MSQQTKRTSNIQFSLVPEYSWWRSADSARLLCVTELRGRGQGQDRQNTEVGVVEVGLNYKKVIPYQTFVDQILKGNLVQVHFVYTAPLIAYHLRTA